MKKVIFLFKEGVIECFDIDERYLKEFNIPIINVIKKLGGHPLGMSPAKIEDVSKDEIIQKHIRDLIEIMDNTTTTKIYGDDESLKELLKELLLDNTKTKYKIYKLTYNMNNMNNYKDSITEFCILV